MALSRKVLGGGIALALVLAADQAVARLYLARYWRPVPPFGALTNELQRGWLERQKDELARAAARAQGDSRDEDDARPPSPPSIGRFDAELGWSNRSGVRAPDGRTSFHPNGHRGARGYSFPKPDAATRIATFGDSFTFCQEVADGETWQVQLEGLDRTLEVPNLGVGGYGTDQAYLRARRELPAWDADVAVLGLMLENIGRNVNRYRPLWYPRSDTAAAKPRFVLRDGALELVPMPFRRRAELVAAIDDGSVLAALAEHEYWKDSFVPDGLGWSGLARLFATQRFYAARELEPLWTDVEGEPFQVTVALLEAFVRFAREEADVEHALVVIFAMEADVRRVAATGERYWEPLLNELEARGIPYVDTSRATVPASQEAEGAPLFVGSHHSARGNGIVAEALWAWQKDAFAVGGQPPRGPRDPQGD